MGGKIVDAKSVESQPFFTGERFSTEKDSQKIQGPDSESRMAHLVLFPRNPHFRVRVRLETCPERRTMKKQQNLKWQQRREGKKLTAF